jgi:hypothetical protein
MKPHLKNIVCAHPEFLIVIALYPLTFTIFLLRNYPSISFLNILSFAAIAAVITIFGFMFLWSFTRKLCSKANGAPYKLNEKVLIIAGANKNRFGLIRGIEKSQGGWPLLVLEIDHPIEAKAQRIYEEYSVIRIK